MKDTSLKNIIMMYAGKMYFNADSIQFDDGDHDEIELLQGKLRVHSVSVCGGDICVIHNQTQHHMLDWPLIWRSDRGIMERRCPHGIGHPDPDDYKIRTKFDPGVHGCDGCCRVKS